jgi:chromosome segregation ATPase
VQETDAKVTDLTAQLEEARQAAAQQEGSGAEAIAELRSQITKLEAELEAAREANAALQAARDAGLAQEQMLQDSQKALTASTAELTDDMDTLKGGRDALAAELQQLQTAAAASADAASAAAEAAATEHERQLEEVARLQAQLAESQSDAGE